MFVFDPKWLAVARAIRHAFESGNDSWPVEWVPVSQERHRRDRVSYAVARPIIGLPMWGFEVRAGRPVALVQRFPRL